MYWEKTVEYMFLWRMTKADRLDFAAPLSGTHERVGDAIFGEGTSLILVEFKRSSAELSSEKDKFKNYSEASDALGNRDGHHFLIFGETSGRSLLLCGQNYFTGKPLSKIDHVIKYGVGEPSFNEYLKEFLAFRKEDGRSGSDGQIGVSEYAAVMGVKAGKIVTACSMQSYVNQAVSFPESSVHAGNLRKEQPRSTNSPRR